MVGVAGKSAACHDCKRRRVKASLSFPFEDVSNTYNQQCDFGRPHCLRCQRVGLHCTGYGKSVVFVHRTSTSLIQTIDAISPPNQIDEVAPSLSPSVVYNQAICRLLAQVHDTSVDRSEFRENAYELLQRSYLPEPHLLGKTPNVGRCAYYWLHAVCHLTGPGRSLDFALLAFCMVQMFIMRIGTASLEHAIRLYTEAIECLRNELEDPSARYVDQTIASIVVLSTCEILVSPVDRGWQAHIKGVSEILRLRPANPSPAWQFMCSRLRIVSMLESLAKERVLALSATEWRDIAPPEASDCDVLEELLITVTSVPCLFEEANAILGGVDDMVCEAWARSVLKALVSAVESIHALIARLREVQSGNIYWACPTSLWHPLDDVLGYKLFPFSLEFASFQHAVILVLAWAFVVLILSKMTNLYTKVYDITGNVEFLDAVLQSLKFEPAVVQQSQAMNHDRPSLWALHVEADKWARHICQSIGYLYRVDMGILGPQSTTYGQWAARKYFLEHPGHDRELEWCLRIKDMRGPAHRFELQLMSFEDERVS